jgi:hypothetical protein
MTDAADDKAIAAYYGLGLERDRLAGGPGPLEFARTRAVLERHLPPPPSDILDVGGGQDKMPSGWPSAGFASTLEPSSGSRPSRRCSA